MGVYNTIITDETCPACHARVEWQSKRLTLNGLVLADAMQTIALRASMDGEMYAFCDACKIWTDAVIQDGKLVEKRTRALTSPTTATGDEIALRTYTAEQLASFAEADRLDAAAQEVVRRFRSVTGTPESVQGALGQLGAWGDLDWNKTEHQLDRIRHENVPTPSETERIATDPAVCDGEPHIRGTRIPVSVLLDNLAAGVTLAELMKSYPGLTPEDVRAALAYAAALARERSLNAPQ